MRDKLLSYFEQEKEIFGSISLDLQKDDFIFTESKSLSTPNLIQTKPVEKQIVNTDQQMRKTSSLNDLKESILNCKACSLCEHRSQVVFGTGNPNSDLMIIGESPGADEDRLGLPFVGKGGQLLTQMLASINISRENVYLANIVNCRPENNRDPKTAEIASCLPFLKQQIEFVKPKLILSLGRISGQALTESKSTLGSLRGEFRSYLGTDLYVTYHPAALLRNPSWKKPTWDDLKRVKARLTQLENN